MRSKVAQNPCPQRLVFFPAREQGTDVFGAVQRMIVVLVSLHVLLRQHEIFPFRLSQVKTGDVPCIFERSESERLQHAVSGIVREFPLLVLQEPEREELEDILFFLLHGALVSRLKLNVIRRDIAL